ncbi:type II toxin-antitoxin system RelE/ParE family toxin [Reichenbachiella agariperforans]|uniref:type II toxin-antitoxin system RelE/ParE family toxin n=1 Tax=Reichenbachiella agariperforans TaxID=156994 RepID=UPI001C08AE04|nr:type II toxin-antitoxin system RelE/ParE family toxin [Reichenbachiella agariperforans]MBU2914372.1 type II toxin-antitoxin system RelE/ParE family toxin [Reichenbachiella agariperforans]
MAYAVEITKAAEEDIRDAYLFYTEQNNGLGHAFEVRLQQAVDSIHTFPFKSQTRFEQTRIIYLKKFPYGVHFRIDKSNSTILIVAVFHTSRDSDLWTTR